MLYVVYQLSARSIALLFFFNDTATTEIYTLSLHDALPISAAADRARRRLCPVTRPERWYRVARGARALCPSSRPRSEEHTSELQSRQYLVCRLLLEKKKHIISPFLLLSVQSILDAHMTYLY